mgnify:CR=1 FL=1
MLLKRHYDPESLQAGAPRVTHVSVGHTGFTPNQNFPDDLVERGQAEGWITVEGDQLTIVTDAEPLIYAIARRPGYFCKSTGESIPMSDRAWLKFRLGNDSSESRAAAQAWLAANGKATDDYDICTTYQCEIAPDLHAKYRAVRTEAGMTVPDHALEG